MPAYSQSTMRTRVAVVEEVRGQQVVVARHRRVLGPASAAAMRARRAVSLPEAGGTATPRARAVAR